MILIAFLSDGEKKFYGVNGIWTYGLYSLSYVEKINQGVNGIRTHGLYVGAAMHLHLSSIFPQFKWLFLLEVHINNWFLW